MAAVRLGYTLANRSPAARIRIPPCAVWSKLTLNGTWVLMPLITEHGSPGLLTQRCAAAGRRIALAPDRLSTELLKP